MCVRTFSLYGNNTDEVAILWSIKSVGETRSLALKEEHTRTLRVFGNRVVMRIFGPTRDEVTAE
jgi:hypothetical protein